MNNVSSSNSRHLIQRSLRERKINILEIIVSVRKKSSNEPIFPGLNILYVEFNNEKRQIN